MENLRNRILGVRFIVIALCAYVPFDLRSEATDNFYNPEITGTSAGIGEPYYSYILPEYPDCSFVWYPGSSSLEPGVYIVNVSSEKHIVIPERVPVECPDPGPIIIEDPIPGILYPVVGNGLFGYESSTMGYVDIYWSSDIMETITFPKTISSLNLGQFDGLTALQKIIIDKDNPIYADHDGILYKYDNDSGNKYKKLLYCPVNWNKSSHLEIPEGTEIIEQNSFYKNKNLVSVSFPESINYFTEDFYNGPFYKCEKLKEVIFNCKSAAVGSWNFGLRKLILSKNTETIQDASINENLVKIEKSDNVRRIMKEALSGCRPMFLNLPNIDSIGAAGLGYCQAVMLGNNPNMKITERWVMNSGGKLSICLLSETPPVVDMLNPEEGYDTSEGKSYVFDGTIYVPQKAVEIYRQHPYWGNFSTIRPIVDKLIPLVSEIELKIKTGQSHEYLWDVMPIGNAIPEEKGEWSVEDPSIASIDRNGRLTGIAPGRTKVIFTLKDTKGNRYAATSRVKVEYDPSSVEDINNADNLMPNNSTEVYDLQGRYLGSSTDRLAPGIYIIRTQQGSRKIAVR